LCGARPTNWAWWLVGSYELLMMIIRSAQAPGTVSAVGRAPERMPDTDPLQGQAAQAFAVELAAGRVPSVRTIRARLHVGQPRAQRVRAYLAALNGAQAGTSREHRAGISEVRSAALRDPPTSSAKYPPARLQHARPSSVGAHRTGRSVAGALEL
jgi:hypothetical protein